MVCPPAAAANLASSVYLFVCIGKRVEQRKTKEKESERSKEREREREREETILKNVDRRIAIALLYIFQHTFHSPWSNFILVQTKTKQENRFTYSNRYHHI